MAITQDIRKATIDTAYAAAGAADLAAEKLGQLVAEAPGRLEQLRRTDPKELGQRVSKGAKEAQAQLSGKASRLAGSMDTDLKKLSQQVQDLALQGVGAAVGYVAKAGETRDKLAERGREAVKTWKGEQAAPASEIPVATEPGSASGSKAEDGSESGSGSGEDAKPAARKTAARKPAAKRAESKEQ
ncbi:hypothetical protein [Streptomyces orinoci]|uniref:Heparin binding hemagglutinin HbhA n=1 Tax=Streptomyces orinoci TaxID=67339 RepID=A0ABV3JV59_STRON|nr:hypothetical protein [Streptomyces orinoci]